MNCTIKDCEKLYTSKDKWTVAILGGLLFMLISSPFLYNLINYITVQFGLQTSFLGCPTFLGLFIHTTLFVLLVRFLMY